MDPYQMARSITTLKQAGVPIFEYPQTEQNTMKMGQTLYDLLKGKNLRLYPSEELRKQALNTEAIEKARGFRIAKEKASKKIDAIVALSMACLAALDTPAHVPLRFLGGEAKPRSPEEIEKEEEERAAELARASHQAILEACRTEGAWGFGPSRTYSWAERQEPPSGCKWMRK